MKFNHKISTVALLAVVASSLAACNLGKKKTGHIQFWSSFGSMYSKALQDICDKVVTDTNVEIEHTQKNSYDDIKKAMDSAIALGDYPNIAMGYPDHFASYLTSDVLKPVQDYFTQAELDDYYPEYMSENKFYDWNNQEKLFAIPFNKSTELLGYNGVFVDYCSTINPDLANIPATWAEWEVKGPLYDAIFQGLMLQKKFPDDPSKKDLIENSGKKVYGVQNEEGRASGFVVVNDGDPAPEGKKLLLDFTKVDPYQSRLMSWDATDNAFITLVRQWGAEYTALPESENTTKQPHKRYGHVRVNVPSNQDKIVEMLKFFNGLNKKHIFGTPTELGGSYSSDAFAKAGVMFMICSSGGLSYNTAKWEHRFSVKPIPYNTADKKYVISQGANICLTDKGSEEDAIKVVKALTTGKFQTEWCLQTGYYPCSKSAANSDEYKAFLNEKTYDSPTRVAYREGSILNTNEYMDSSKHWTKFVDPAFDGSSEVRTLVKGVLDGIFALPANAPDADYRAKLNQLESADISGNIVFDHE